MLIDKLKKYAENNIYPMHMPGHKRNTKLLSPCFPYNLDISEIHGFDDLRFSNAELGETAELAAKLYGSKKAYLLINGSTAGILAAIGAHTKRGDKILFTKSCHRSVHNAVSLFGLSAVYITPRIDEASNVECSITTEMIETAFDKNPDIKLVVITSPSYEGVISDINSISAIAHRYGTIVLVDSAHGAHLGFSGGFPDSAARSGADVVVMSLHKTLPALTQCSLLHVCSDRADIDEIYRMLFILQTSSPSYILMASIDYCLRLLDSDRDKLFKEYGLMLSRFYNEVRNLKHLYVIDPQNEDFKKKHPGFFAFDPGKIVIATKNASLEKESLAGILRNEYKIELEATHPKHAIAMTSICDTKKGFDRLAKALKKIDSVY